MRRQKKHSEQALSQYAAFISYSHNDEKIAADLQRRLERFSIPAALAKEVGRARIGQVFRDRLDLASSTDLGRDIIDALDRSECLILICSPSSAKSTYVSQEVQHFKSTGKGQRILAVIVNGEPYASIKSGYADDDECFPRALIYQLDEYGDIAKVRETSEPLAADLRKGKDGPRLGFQKIVAGILRVRLDDLLQRQKQADRVRRRWWITGSLATFALGLFAVWSAFEAIQNRETANQQEEIARQRQVEAQQSAYEYSTKRSEAFAERSVEVAGLSPFDLVSSNEAILLSLYGDPRGTRTNVDEMFTGDEGHSKARAALVTALMSSQLRESYGRIRGTALVHDQSRKVALAGQSDWSALLLDLSSGETLARLKNAKNADANSSTYPIPLNKALAISDDGKNAITSNRDGTANYWNLEQKKIEFTLSGHDRIMIDVAISPDKRFAVTVAPREIDCVHRIWDLRTNRLVKELLVDTLCDEDTQQVAFSPDNQLVAIADMHKVHFLDLSSMNVVSTIERNEDVVVKNNKEINDEIGYASAFEFSADGGNILVGYRHGYGENMTSSAVLWEVRTARVIAEFNRLDGWIDGVKLSQDKSLALIASEYGAVELWNVSDGQREQSVRLPSDPLAIFFGDSTNEIVTVGPGIHIWSVDDPNLLFRFSDGGSLVNSLDVNSDGSLLIAGFEDSTALLWDSESAQLLHTFSGHEYATRAVAISPAGDIVITGDCGGNIRVWDSSNGNQISLMQVLGDCINFLQLGQDPSKLLGASNYGGGAALIDIQSGTIVSRFAELGKTVLSGALGQDDRTIILGSSLGSAQIWDLGEEATIATLSYFDEPSNRLSAYAVDLDTSEKQALVSLGGTQAMIWDYERNSITASLVGHSDSIDSVDLGRGAKIALTGSSDGTAVLWDVTAAEAIATVTDSTDAITSVKLNNMGTRAFTGSAGGVVSVWAIPDIVYATAEQQVAVACDTLRSRGAPLAFSIDDVARYPLLQTEPLDPEQPDLYWSPCS